MSVTYQTVIKVNSKQVVDTTSEAFVEKGGQKIPYSDFEKTDWAAMDENPMNAMDTSQCR